MVKKWLVQITVSYLRQCPTKKSHAAVCTGRRWRTKAFSSVRPIGLQRANNSEEGIRAGIASLGRNVSTVPWP